MSIPPRIAVPVVAATLMVAAFIGVLFWQLEGTREFLSKQLSMATGSGMLADVTLRNVADPQTTDEALLHLRKGDLFGLRGQWNSAAAEYQKAVESKGGLTALRKLAGAQLQRRDIRGAQTTLDQMRREGARPEDVLLLESVILLRTGEVSKAQQLLEAASDSPHKQYGLALVAIVGGDHETAKTQLQAVADGWEPVLRSHARILLAAYDEYALFPQSPVLHLQTLLSRALAQVQECELALPMLAQVTQTQDDYRDAWIVQGYCELTSERYAESLASLEHAYQLDPEKPEIQYFLAQAYIAQGDHGNALTFLQYALRNGFEPQSEVRRLIAQEALQIGNASLALEQFEKLTGESEADIDTFSAYVSAAITANKKEEAYAKAQEAAGKWPDEAQAHYLVGWSALETERTDEAKLELQKALEMNPGMQEAKDKLKKL